MLPQETLFEILANLNRRDFDVLELVNRALGALITTNFNDIPRRVISLIFYEEGLVMLTCPSDGWRRVPAVELPRYLPRSVITKMVFKSTATTVTEETYQALLPCRSHFAADAVCDFRSLSVFPPDILHRALTEVFMCNTLVFADTSVMNDLRRYMGEQDLTALPCLASCANLQIAYNNDVLSDANGALEWLLGTHGAPAGVKQLSIGGTWSGFLEAFVDAVEKQFIRATTPAPFKVDLLCFVGNRQGPDVGTNRELENVVTNELLKIEVDTDVRKPNGEPTFKTKVAIQRKPTA